MVTNMLTSDGDEVGINVEPQVLFVYPPDKPLPLKYKDLLSFCFPGGVEVRAVERSPSLSELNEILLGQEHIKQSDLSFVFRLQVADDSSLYGCCVLVEEPKPHLSFASCCGLAKMLIHVAPNWMSPTAVTVILYSIRQNSLPEPKLFCFSCGFLFQTIQQASIQHIRTEESGACRDIVRRVARFLKGHEDSNGVLDNPSETTQATLQNPQLAEDLDFSVTMVIIDDE
ncbi:hypothetical protein HPP92_007955 [Vanilla planifolia]|uniref:uDENN domain-containing protein n=1 Tax=Vanilla planifolia TaxID=51239 RepID=A0A835V6D7_VANPL|nr:hypothetical protein HPP92_007955 [Vanilla planifolia]